MNKLLNHLPLDNERINSITEPELLYLLVHISTLGCKKLARLAKRGNDKMEISSMHCKFPLKKKANNCLGNVKVLDSQDTSDETIQKMQTCLEDNEVEAMIRRINSTVHNSMHESKHFKKIYRSHHG